jgi:hypothetical protein
VSHAHTVRRKPSISIQAAGGKTERNGEQDKKKDTENLKFVSRKADMDGR